MTQTLLQDSLKEIPAVIRARGLTACIQNAILTTRRGQRFLFLPLDTRRALEAHRSLAPYTEPTLLHDMATRLREKHPTARVLVSNSSGLRYCVPLDGVPALPASVLYPATVEADRLPLGVSLGGPLHVTPEQFNGALLTGAQGSGKSNFLHVLALAARQNNWETYLADAEGHTFAPAAWNPVAAVPVAVSLDELKVMAQALSDEIDRRSQLFLQAADDSQMPPPDLPAYNRVAARRGLPRLARLLCLCDEANSYFDSAGVAETFADLARRGRKWGLLLVMAAHSWRSRDVSRSLSSMLTTRVCFRVADDTSGEVVLGSHTAGKQAMQLQQKGRAYIVLEGKRSLFQAYYADEGLVKEMLLAARRNERRPPQLDEVQARLVRYAVQNLAGEFIINRLAEAFTVDGITHHRVRKLAEQWETCGWLKPGAGVTDGRKVTPELAHAAGI